MPRRRQQPTTLELSDRDYNRLRRRLEDLEDADTRAEVREAEAALERLAAQLKLDDDLTEDLLEGRVQLADDDDDGDGDGRSSSRRRRDDDDDDGARGRRSSSRRRDDDDDGRSGSGAGRARRLRRAADDDDGGSDDDDAGDGGRRAGSLRQLRRDPDAQVTRRKKDAKPAATPDTTHWFHRPVGRREVTGQA
jgi:hypothetical protein